MSFRDDRGGEPARDATSAPDLKLASDVASALCECQTASMAVREARLSAEKLTRLRTKIVSRSRLSIPKLRDAAERQRRPLDVLIDRLAGKAPKGGRLPNLPHGIAAPTPRTTKDHERRGREPFTRSVGRVLRVERVEIPIGT